MYIFALLTFVGFLLAWGIYFKKYNYQGLAGIRHFWRQHVFWSIFWKVFLVVIVVNMFRPRTGYEMYVAVFGKPKSNCVQVLDSQDQVVPIIDYAIFLHFKTCPAELKRILALHPFTVDRILPGVLSSEVVFGGWYRQQGLGDTIMMFSYRKNNYDTGQIIYVSEDSTEVFFMDASS